MKQFHAGDKVDFLEHGDVVQLKVEDASKSDAISAKVLKSSTPRFQVGMVYEFDRAQFAHE